ncbi:MAG: helix-hairpin-helix domain-containing protein, partial [Chloroflexi bacterium]|nr:helix-hairpin-helix domain-containing protein [Chloroflexota bacterium]
SPGVYTLDPDSRITDALAAAGGVTSEAILDGLNLALRVKDEAEYHVLTLGETPPAASNSSPANTGPSAQPGGLIDLNLASVQLLDTLPGIGPALAEAIVAYRENVGLFQSVAEVQEVPKIGPVTYQNIRELVTVSGVR